MPRSAIIISSRTTICSSNGPTPTAFSTIWTSPRGYVAQCEERHGRVAVEQTLDAAHALMSHGDRSLSGQEEARSACGGAAGQGPPRQRGEHLQRSVANHPGRAAQDRVRAEHRKTPRAARAAAGKFALLSGKVGATFASVATRTDPHRPPHRPIFLSPRSDQSHERRDGHLRALSHHDQAARTGAHQRRQLS